MMKTLSLFVGIFLIVPVAWSLDFISKPGMIQANQWTGCSFQWTVNGTVDGNYSFQQLSADGTTLPLSWDASPEADQAKGLYTLTFSDIELSDAGNYSLTIRDGNTSVTDSSALLFVFGYSQASLNETSGSSPANVGDTIELTCNVTSTSLPEKYRPPMTYFWNTQAVSSGDLEALPNGSLAPAYGSVVSGYATRDNGSVLIIKSLRLLDSQIYCYGKEEGSTSYSQARFYLQINSKPVVTSTSPSSTTSNVDVGGYVYFSLNYEAYPSVTSGDWEFTSGSEESKRLLPVGTYSTGVSNGYAPTGVSNGYAQFTLSSTDFYGNYTVTLNNSLGSTAVTFSVVPPGPPNTPTGLHATDLTFLSIQLQWYDIVYGGIQEYFIIKLTDVLSNKLIDSQNVTGYYYYYDNNNYNASFTAQFVKGIQPEIEYKVSLTAWNDLGESKPVTLTLTTPKKAVLDVSSKDISFSGSNVTIDITVDNVNQTSAYLQVQCCAVQIPFCLSVNFYNLNDTTNEVVVNGVPESSQYVFNFYLYDNGYSYPYPPYPEPYLGSYGGSPLIGFVNLQYTAN